ncbi:MAG: hypothetical protein Q4F83_00960 [Eubacteriales bacterium]|nr:hypothetical protein [Eubacteriales bacterium]
MKKIFTRSISVILFIVCFVACGKGLNYILVDDTNSYTRVMMHQLYEPEKNIDVIFIGSSHVYRSLIPAVTDVEFGCYTFNAGSSGQFMDGSAALIKEAATYNDLSHVYLELYYGVAEDVDHSERTNMTATYIISDYMKPSLRRIRYLLQASSKDYWTNGFILARRNWTDFFDSDYVRNLIEKKQSNNYKNYILTNAEGQEEYYVDRGFVANDNVVSERTYWNSIAYGSIAVDNLSGSDWERSLLEAINYCKKNNIEITLFVAPEPEWTIVGKGNYQEYHDYVQKLAADKNVTFYDFNLCSNKYLDANDGNLFKDSDHLNTYGAEAFSHLFGQFFTGKLKADDLFYDSYSEKLNEEEPVVYGIAGPKDNSETGLRDCYMISNRNSGIEYRIIATTSEGKQYYIQDFDENRSFSLPTDEAGTLTVVWRITSESDTVNSFEAAY